MKTLKTQPTQGLVDFDDIEEDEFSLLRKTKFYRRNTKKNNKYFIRKRKLTII